MIETYVNLFEEQVGEFRTDDARVWTEEGRLCYLETPHEMTWTLCEEGLILMRGDELVAWNTTSPVAGFDSFIEGLMGRSLLPQTISNL